MSNTPVTRLTLACVELAYTYFCTLCVPICEPLAQLFILDVICGCCAHRAIKYVGAAGLAIT
eukprot:12468404-Heterocapsa_arctica.AAC.1